MNKEKIRKVIENGNSILGIELGSTRIKAILIDDKNNPIASGNFDWSSSFIEGVWTYSLKDVENGLAFCYQALKKDVFHKYNIVLKEIKSIGISAMMHGFIALDKDKNLLTPFRTWRNNITLEQSSKLIKLFNYPIPQRWSISHLLYSIENEEDFLNNLDYVSTLSSYVHRLLSNERVVGIGDASGMFPIDINTNDYNQSMINKFDEQFLYNRYSWRLKDIFPKVLIAGKNAGKLSQKGALLLDKEGDLKCGSIMCAPEGDAATGMIATNSILPRTGNVSAGTSVFSMIVLEKELSKVYEEIDLVATPDGKLVAMAHTNNCTSEYDSWIKLFKEVIESNGFKIDTSTLYDNILYKALSGNKECGGLLSYNYVSGEHVTGFSKGAPLFVKTVDSKFNLSNFMRSQLFSSLCSMKVGLNILLKKEKVKLDLINGHGGFFKTAEVGQKIMASAFNVPCGILSNAGEGGAWGIAILASYAVNNELNLATFLTEKVFNNAIVEIINPSKEDVEGFNEFFIRFCKGLPIERIAVDILT